MAIALDLTPLTGGLSPLGESEWTGLGYGTRASGLQPGR